MALRRCAGPPLSLLLVALFMLITAHGVAGHEVKVTFKTKKSLGLGQRMVIAGGLPELGSWVPVAGAHMSNEWKVTTILDMPKGTIVEYKPVITSNGTANNPQWYPGYNLAFEIPDEDDIEIPIIWPDTPACPVKQVM